MNKSKYVTYRNLKVGQEIGGTQEPRGFTSFRGYVKEITPSHVTVEMWRKGGHTERFSTEYLFEVQMDDDEFRKMHNEAAGELIQKVQNTLYYDEIGYHEMANGWLSSDPWEMAADCKKRKYNVLGHCREISPKRSMFSGELLDVGVCVEEEDGNRFWCHFRGDDINIMVRRYEKYQEALRTGKTDGFNPFHVKWDYLEEMSENESKN